MARQLRTDFEGAWHHVMNRGRRKEMIFPNSEDRLDFLRLLGVVHDRYDIEIHAHALMGNHYHLLVRTPSGGLSRAMKHVDGVFAQRFNRRYELDGPLFRDRFRAKLVDSDNYLGVVSRYIHRNPIALVGEENLASYEWSSYYDFLQQPSTRPAWLFDGALRIAGVKTAAQLKKHTLGQSPRTFDPDDFPRVIGDADFVNAALARTKVDGQTVGHLRAGVVRPTVAEIGQAVSKVFSDERDHRLVWIGLCQEVGGLTLRAIADQFGYSSPQSAGNATHRFRKRTECQQWALQVEKVRKGLQGRMVDERCRRVMDET